jgi:4'-phosphopantetheinyl transferase
MTTLNSTRIDLWQFSLQSPYSPADKAILSSDEMARAQRFYFSHHQRRFTKARCMLRRILGAYLTTPPKILEFAYNAQGKPSLITNPCALEFNLSHSGELGLLAIGQTYPMGVDLEFFSSRPYLGISRELFSHNEQQALLALPQALQPMGFFNIWAQKEAIMKAMGIGLAYATQHLNFPLIPSQPFNFTDTYSALNWTMRPWMPSPLCAAALCHHPSITEIRWFNEENLCD